MAMSRRKAGKLVILILKVQNREKPKDRRQWVKEPTMQAKEPQGEVTEQNSDQEDREDHAGISEH